MFGIIAVAYSILIGDDLSIVLTKLSADATVVFVVVHCAYIISYTKINFIK